MAEFPSLEIFTDAYLADTGDLTDAEHGCYLMMMMIAWRRPDNDLEDDMEWLRRAIAAHCRNMHGHHFNAIVPKLLERFWYLCTNPSTGRRVWKQKRLEKERQFRRKQSAKQRENILKRWSGTSENNDLADTTVSDPGNTPHPTLKEEVSTLSTSSARATTEIPVSGGTVGPQPPKRYPNGSHTIEDPKERIARFQANLVDHLLSRHAVKDHSEAWDLVAAAFDTKHKTHARALAICRKYAAEIGKGWPLPTPPRPP